MKCVKTARNRLYYLSRHPSDMPKTPKMSLWVHRGAAHRPKSGFTVWLHRQRRARYAGCHKNATRDETPSRTAQTRPTHPAAPSVHSAHKRPGGRRLCGRPERACHARPQAPQPRVVATPAAQRISCPHRRHRRRGRAPPVASDPLAAGSRAGRCGAATIII